MIYKKFAKNDALSARHFRDAESFRCKILNFKRSVRIPSLVSLSVGVNQSFVLKRALFVFHTYSLCLSDFILLSYSRSQTKNMSGDTKSALDYDEVLRHIGQFGPWQRKIHFLLWLTSAAGGLAVVVFTFTAFNMGHRCQNPYCDGPNGPVVTDTSKIEQSCEYSVIGKLNKS